ncbi:hypothetical protein FIBSPDRAFT_900776 [Athelia psychrophila]|uniref:Uncharacterized protein n=1 Tax=Athelia psychrophila TaxID=1759441 RepID=A0A165XZR8_9AGAM|nr:hypothetical protein FIBSPDRAFT_900776 [Fibularhizoctonia sp. CBS 109695]
MSAHVVPPKKVSGAGRKAKQQKQDPLAFTRHIVIPWAQSVLGPSAVADEHESDDNNDHDSRRKKPMFDTELEELVGTIDTQYWRDSQEVGVGCTNSQHAIKKTPSTPVPSAGPSMHAPQSPSPASHGFGQPEAPFLYFGFPLVPPPVFFPPPWASQPSSSAHPCSSPPPAGLSFDRFCTQYSISGSARQGLQNLGFEPGDDLSVVADAEFKEAGFTCFSFYRRYKQDHKV